MTEQKPPPKGATIIFFPRDRIVRTILKEVYDPGPRYPQWDEERCAPPMPPKGAA
jgi:hypothetical protein